MESLQRVRVGERITRLRGGNLAAPEEGQLLDGHEIVILTTPTANPGCLVDARAPGDVKQVGTVSKCKVADCFCLVDSKGNRH